MNNSKLIKEKVELIRERFPESLECNPHNAKELVKKIKESFFELGYYKNKERLYDPTADESVMKLIRRVQGEVVTNRPRKASRRSV